MLFYNPWYNLNHYKWMVSSEADVWNKTTGTEETKQNHRHSSVCLYSVPQGTETADCSVVLQPWRCHYCIKTRIGTKTDLIFRYMKLLLFQVLLSFIYNMILHSIQWQASYHGNYSCHVNKPASIWIIIITIFSQGVHSRKWFSVEPW